MPEINPLFDSGALDEMLGTAAPAATPAPAPAPAPAPRAPVTPTPAPVATGAPKDEYKDMPISEVAGRALKAAPESLLGVGKSMVEPILHPIQTAESLEQVAKGAYSKAAGALGAKQDPAQKEKEEAAINAIGSFYADRYGSIEGLKKAFAEDPAGVMADISVPLTMGGGAAARLPGTLGKVGELAATAGKVIEPTSMVTKPAAALAEPLAAAAGKVTAVPLWFKTGESFRSLDDAVKAGATQNEEFWKHLSGQGSSEDVVNRAQNAISKIAEKRSQDYIAGMKDIRESTDPLPYDKIDSAYINQLPKAYSLGKVFNQEAKNALDQTGEILARWKNQEAMPGAHTMEDFDKLKRALDEVHYKYSKDFGAESPAAKAVSDVRKSVFETIKDKDPKYAETMEKYAQTTKHLNELRKELVGGQRVSVGTKVRKLLKAQDSAHKGALLEGLSEFDPDLPFAIAGHELSSGLPQGIRGTIASALSASGLYAVHPAALAGLALSSPRVAGALQYGIGRAGAVPREIEQAIPAMARTGAYAVGEEKERQGRATGGRAGKIYTAQQMLSRAKSAEKAIARQTESILSEPDERVVSALKIANEHI